MIDVALHDPREAVANADDLDAFEASADRGRADDRVDAGGRATTDEDGKLVMRHDVFSFQLSAVSSQLAAFSSDKE